MNTAMNTRMKICILAMAALVGGSAFAHGKDGVHLKGTVKAIDAQSVTVTTTEQQDVTAHVDAKTKFERGDAPASAKDVRPGEKVVVHAQKMKDGQLHAHIIKLPKSASAEANDKPAAKPPTETAKEAGHEHGQH